MFINSIKKVGWEVGKEQDTCWPRKGREHNWACKWVMMEGFRETVMSQLAIQAKAWRRWRDLP